jgi:hypothetical protein
VDYVGAVSTQRGRCFRFVYDEHDKPDNCPQPITDVGWIKIGARLHQVDSCAEHAAQLRQGGRDAPS